MNEEVRVISFVEAVPKSPYPGKYSALRNQLKTNPGKWALIYEGPDVKRSKNLSNNFKPNAGFKAALRTFDGAVHVYARYDDIAQP